MESGEILWEYTSNLDANQVRVCCGWTNRGLAMGDGKLYFGSLDATLVALDQRTGEVAWTIQEVDSTLGYSFTAAPLYYDGMVIFGYVGGDLGIRGRISAYDADSGEYRWHFQQIRHDIWAYDSPNPPILFNAEINGALRKGIAQVPKTGYLHVLDRATGEPIHEVIDTPVPQVPGRATAATQPIPSGEEILPPTIDMAPEGWPLVNEGRTFTPLPMDGSVIPAAVTR